MFTFSSASPQRRTEINQKSDMRLCDQLSHRRFGPRAFSGNHPPIPEIAVNVCYLRPRCSIFPSRRNSRPASNKSPTTWTEANHHETRLPTDRTAKSSLAALGKRGERKIVLPDSCLLEPASQRVDLHQAWNGTPGLGEPHAFCWARGQESGNEEERADPNPLSRRAIRPDESP